MFSCFCALKKQTRPPAGLSTKCETLQYQKELFTRKDKLLEDFSSTADTRNQTQNKKFFNIINQQLLSGEISQTEDSIKDQISNKRQSQIESLQSLRANNSDLQNIEEKNKIEMDFDELQKIQNQIHENIFQKLSGVRQKIVLIQTELDLIVPVKDICPTSLQAPSSLNRLKKTIEEEVDENSLHQQTLQQAQNAFYCHSINQEFSRSVITRSYNLAIKIFQIKG